MLRLEQHKKRALNFQRDGLAGRMVNNLPHVTPSPRVSAANLLRRSASRHIFSSSDVALLRRVGLMESKVINLPHVTPSPRVPAANLLFKPASSLKSSFIHSCSPRESRTCGVYGTKSASRSLPPQNICSQSVTWVRLSLHSYNRSPRERRTRRGAVAHLPHVTPSPKHLQPISKYPGSSLSAIIPDLLRGPQGPRSF
jgi:hypothetical protein